MNIARAVTGGRWLAYAQWHEYAAARAELAVAQALLPDDPQVIALARVFERLPTPPPA